jgi:glycosylphosphatidylinositol transamidase (GPIT) subunit GPI8
LAIAVFGLSLIRNFSHISISVSFVIDRLHTSVRELNVIRSRDDCAIAAFFMAEIQTTFIVVNSILEAVRHKHHRLGIEKNKQKNNKNILSIKLCDVMNIRLNLQAELVLVCGPFRLLSPIWVSIG